MKNYGYDIKYVNAMNFIIVDLLQPVTKTVSGFDIKWGRNNEKMMTYCHLTLCNGYLLQF